MNFNDLSQEVIELAKPIKLLLMDCDGVLTDGRLYFSKNGEELKSFHVHDGQGIVNLHKAGIETGIITGRKSEILENRAKELNIKYLVQNSKNKVEDFQKILTQEKLSPQNIAYIGDDIGDLELLKLVNLSIAVANCVSELKTHANYITNKNGGLGAVREATELILKAQKK